MKYLILLILIPSLVKASCYCEDDDIEVSIAREAIHQGVSVDLALAVAKVESGMNPKAIGPKGELGLFQIMPYNAPGAPLLNVNTNIRVGVALIKKFLAQCADMGEYAIICYNSGPNRRPKHPSKHPYYLKIASNLP